MLLLFFGVSPSEWNKGRQHVLSSEVVRTSLIWRIREKLEWRHGFRNLEVLTLDPGKLTHQGHKGKPEWSRAPRGFLAPSQFCWSHRPSMPGPHYRDGILEEDVPGSCVSGNPYPYCMLYPQSCKAVDCHQLDRQNNRVLSTWIPGTDRLGLNPGHAVWPQPVSYFPVLQRLPLLRWG